MRNKREGNPSGKGFSRSEKSDEKRSYSSNRNEGDKKPYRDSVSQGKSHFARKREDGETRFTKREDGDRKPYASRTESSRYNDSDRKTYPKREDGDRKPYASRTESSRYNDSDRKPYAVRRKESDRKPYVSRFEGDERPRRPKRDDSDLSYEERASAKMIDRNSLEDETRNTYIYGRHPVIEAINGETSINKVWIGEGTRDTDKIIEHVKDKNIPYKIVSKMKLSHMVGEDTNHQGVVAEVAGKEYTELHELVELAGKKPVFYIILDKLEDPHNLGAVIRTADAVGADAVIIPKHRAVGLTGIVTKSSAGAIERMKICRVSNLVQAIEELKKANVWVVGVDMEAKEIYSEANLKNSIALTVGGEGEGLTHLVKENCDFIVKIPMQSKSNSLNVSVATAVVAYEIFKQREFKVIGIDTTE